MGAFSEPRSGQRRGRDDRGDRRRDRPEFADEERGAASPEFRNPIAGVFGGLFGEGL
jgi:hypothetical protein